MKRFAHLTDIHLNEQDPVDLGVDAQRNWERILRDVSGRHITDIVFGGDIGDHSAHEWFFRSLEGFQYQLCLGNHDQYEQVIKHFRRHTIVDKTLCYTEEDDVFRRIYLDTSRENVAAEQITWLKAQLNTPKKILVFMHHPFVQVDTPIDRAYPLENRNTVLDCFLHSTKEVTVFCGHYHLDDDSEMKNIRQIITPSSAYQVIKDAPAVVEDGTRFGYRVVTVDEDRIQTETVMFSNDKQEPGHILKPSV